MTIDTPFSVTVTATDSFGNVVTGYTGTVQFSTSDPAAQPPVLLPGPYTFVAADLGIHIFSFGVSLVTVGNGDQSVTVADGNGLTSSITVYFKTAGPFVQSIDRATPASPVTNATSVVYTVTFDKPVTGVDAADFQVAGTGSVAATVSQVVPVSNTVYAVTVGGITGSGTLGLNLVDNGSIHDLAGDPLTQANASASFQTLEEGNQHRYPNSVAVADVNGDGKPDLIVAYGGNNSSVGVLLGNGNGTFQLAQTFGTGNRPTSIAVADVNGDGKPDLVVANYTYSVSVLRGYGNGTFQNQTTFATSGRPTSVAVADVNGDGKPDLVVADLNNGVSVLLGNGHGSFQNQTTFATGRYPASLAVADLTGDGKSDLVVANDNVNPAFIRGSNSPGNVSVLFGNGNGTFQNQVTYATGIHPLSAAVADVNGDGIPDLVVANLALAGTVSVLLGNGNGTFQNQAVFPAGEYPVSLAIADLTGDGKPDLIVANKYSNCVSVLMGNGNGTFQNPITFATGSEPDFVTVADLTGDGKPDLVVTNVNSNSNSVSVLLNSVNGNFTGQTYTIVNAPYLAVGMPNIVTAGKPSTITVAAYDASGNVLTGYTGTVHFSTSDVGVGSTAPPDYTFLPSDGGVHVFTSGVTLVTPGNQIVTATDTLNSATTGSATASVSPGVATSLTLTAPAAATDGTAFAITVTAEDSLGNIATGYTGTVSFTTSDPGNHPPVVLPGAYTFVAADGGIRVFSFGVTLIGTGTQTITVTDTNGLASTASVILPSPWPYVQSIARTTPLGPVTNASNLVYTVTFNEPVTAVDAADFQLATTGLVAATISKVTPVSGSVYVVSVAVNAVTGTGTLGLNLVDNGSIRDLAGDPLTQAQELASFSNQTTFAGGPDPQSLAVADVNGDGIPDLVVANYNGYSAGVLLGNGNGTFQKQTTYQAGNRPASVAVADLTDNGKPDLIVADELSNCVSVLLGNGNGTFQSQSVFGTGEIPVFVAVADVTGDGIPDLIVANKGSNDISILLGNGNGTFQNQITFATGLSPRAVAVADLTGDGIPDLVVLNYTNDTASLLLGNGNGTFQNQTTFSTGGTPRGLTVADVNGDGIPDLVAANDASGTVSVLLGNGNGTFQNRTTFAVGYGPSSVAVADVAGDGKADLVVTNNGTNPVTLQRGNVSVLLGNGNGTFQSQTTFADIPGSTLLAVADLTGDGKPDIVVNPYSASLGVLLNTANGNFTGQVYTLHGSPYLVVSLPASVTAGTAFTFTVTAYDAASTVLTSYTGTVHFATSDSGAAMPADYTFTASDGGVHVFTGAATLVTAGIQAVTATDTSSGVITGSAALTVNPSAVTALSLTAPTIATEGTAFAVTVSAKDSFGNIVPNYTGTISFTTSDPAPQPPLVLPSNYTFVAGDQGVHIFSFGVTLVTIGAGSQTITVADNHGLTSTVTVQLLTPWPVVQSINRSVPSGSIANGAGVAYTVTFSEPVTGVDAADFQLARTGTVTATLGQVTPVSASVYTVTVSAISGSGTLGLNLVDNGSIKDLAGNGLAAPNAAASFQHFTTFAAGSGPYAVVTADVNGDGKPDLIVANSNGQNVGVLLGNGNGTFQSQRTFSAGPSAILLRWRTSPATARPIWSSPTAAPILSACYSATATGRFRTRSQSLWDWTRRPWRWRTSTATANPTWSLPMNSAIRSACFWATATAPSKLGAHSPLVLCRTLCRLRMLMATASPTWLSPIPAATTLVCFWAMATAPSRAKPLSPQTETRGRSLWPT